MELTIEQALQQGVAAHSEGRLQDAEGLYRAVLQADPLHPDATHNLGLVALAVHKFDEALPLLKAALDAHPQVEQFWLSYIEALIMEGQFETAKQVLADAQDSGLSGEKFDSLRQHLISSSDGSSPSQSELNDLLKHYQDGRYADAEKLATSITREFPNHQFAWKVLGALFGQSEKLDDALFAHENAVRINPKDAEAYNNMSVALQELGRLEEAEASCRQAVALEPEYAEAHYNLGVTLRELGNLEEAEINLKRALDLKPGYSEAHSELGIMLHRQRRLEEAAVSFRQAISLQSDDASAHYNLGATLQKLGNWEEAEASLRQAIALEPSNAEAHNNLGNTLK